MDKIVITGGTGFIGLSLAKHLSKNGFEPILIARNKPKDHISNQFIQWDGHSMGAWSKSIEGAKAVVNLAGKTVDCIKTPENCDLILRSRVESTKILGKALNTLENPPKVWIQMSTAHIYGDPPQQRCSESSSFGYGLAPFVGRTWEETFLTSIPSGIRGVRLRTSFVIGRNGGALSSLRHITRLGLGGKVGHGKQGFSWIHENDLNELILQAILDDRFDGAYIASAPNPVSNALFMKTLRNIMKIPFGLPTPAWLARFGAKLFFNTDPDLALYGRFVKSERLEKEGFTFQFPELKSALQDLLN